VTRQKYWKTPVQNTTAATKRKAELKLCVLHAMHIIKSSMTSVNSMSITSCIRKAGFVNISEQLAKGIDEEQMEEEDWNEVTSNPEIQRHCKL
jgi:hypothetical protein